MTPRIPALPADQWPKEMRGALAALRPANPRHPILSSAGDRPKGLNLLGTFAQHPDLTTSFHTFVGHLLYGTTLSLRQREMIILRVATQRACDYEWLQHVVIGTDVGLSSDEIQRIRTGEGWNGLEGALLAAVDQLIATGKVDDQTWTALASEFDAQQLMDLVFTVGGYDALAMALLSFGVELDDDLKNR